MTTKLHDTLLRRFQHRDKEKPWVFWQRYWSRKEGKFVEGPFRDRKKNNGHALPESRVSGTSGSMPCGTFGASVLEKANVSISSIQHILGHENRTTTGDLSPFHW